MVLNLVQVHVAQFSVRNLTVTSGKRHETFLSTHFKTVFSSSPLKINLSEISSLSDALAQKFFH